MCHFIFPTHAHHCSLLVVSFRVQPPPGFGRQPNGKLMEFPESVGALCGPPVDSARQSARFDISITVGRSNSIINIFPSRRRTPAWRVQWSVRTLWLWLSLLCCLPLGKTAKLIRGQSMQKIIIEYSGRMYLCVSIILQMLELTNHQTNPSFGGEGHPQNASCGSNILRWLTILDLNRRVLIFGSRQCLFPADFSWNHYKGTAKSYILFHSLLRHASIIYNNICYIFYLLKIYVFIPY